MKTLLTLVVVATLLMLSARVAYAFRVSRTHGLGLLYHNCPRDCQRDPDLTVTNNSDKEVYLKINGHAVRLRPHQDMEIQL